MRFLLLTAIFGASLLPLPSLHAQAAVQLLRVPDAGIQPQIAVDKHHVIHLVYFRGDPASGNLFYVKSSDGVAFSKPIPVNSSPGSAVALGNIRGARIAFGRDGNVFVVWNGSARNASSPGRVPMFFTRLNASHTAFEPERNLIHTAWGIDGGGSVAADSLGHVYVFWHAPLPGQQGESQRRIWLTRSDDDGKSFAVERVAWNQPTGACGCCSLAAAVGPHARLYVLFRSAEQTIHRDMYLLESVDHGATFHGSDISRWNLGYCAMSSEAFAGSPAGMFAAWETEKQVHVASVANPIDHAVSPSASTQKYPALALNNKGRLLVAWTEGMAWNRGGSLHWQLLDDRLHNLAVSGSSPGVPPWSLVAAYAKPDGNFVVLY